MSDFWGDIGERFDKAYESEEDKPSKSFKCFSSLIRRYSNYSDKSDISFFKALGVLEASTCILSDYEQNRLERVFKACFR